MDKEKILFLFFLEYLQRNLDQDFDHINIIRNNPLDIVKLVNPSSFVRKNAILNNKDSLSLIKDTTDEENHFIVSNWNWLNPNSETSAIPSKFHYSLAQVHSRSFIENKLISNPQKELIFSKDLDSCLYALLVHYMRKEEGSVVLNYFNFKENSLDWGGMLNLFTLFLFPEIKTSIQPVSKIYTDINLSFPKEILKIKISLS